MEDKGRVRKTQGETVAGAREQGGVKELEGLDSG